MTPTELSNISWRLGFVEGVLLGLSLESGLPKAEALQAALDRLDSVQDIVAEEMLKEVRRGNS